MSAAPVVPISPARNFQIEYWPIDKVIPYQRNARLIPQSAIDKVARSLREFGWRQPIVVDTAAVIVVGHCRWLSAKHEGMMEVPVHSVNIDSDEQLSARKVGRFGGRPCAVFEYCGPAMSVDDAEMVLGVA